MMNCCGAAREGPLRWCAEAGMQEMPSRLRAKNSQLSSHNHFIIETFFFFFHLEGNFCQQMPFGWMALMLVHGVNVISARDEQRCQTCRDFPSPFLSHFVSVIFPWGSDLQPCCLQPRLGWSWSNSPVIWRCPLAQSFCTLNGSALPIKWAWPLPRKAFNTITCGELNITLLQA